MNQSREDLGRLNGNLSANSNAKNMAHPRVKERGVSHLELLNLIFPASPETRPAMQEQERTLGILVTAIKIFYRAKIELVDGETR